MLLQNLPRDLFAGQSRLALHRAIDAGASEAAVAALLAAFPELAAVTEDRVRSLDSVSRLRAMRSLCDGAATDILRRIAAVSPMQL